MEKFYWVDGDGFIKLLAANGYVWSIGESPVGSGENINEKFIVPGYSYVPVIDYDAKTLKLYPLEIYAPNSPTADREKFKAITDKCGDFDDLKHDVEAACQK